MGFGGNFTADGLVMFENARIGGYFLVEEATFAGKASEHHGFFAPSSWVNGVFVWQDVSLENGAILDLSGANVGALLDDGIDEE